MNKIVNIDKYKIGGENPVFFVAEIGGNHNGDVNLARQMIDAAFNVGVNAVKFQTYITDNVLSRKSPYYSEFKREQLSFEDFSSLMEYCKNKGVIFFSTPFDFESVDFLDHIGVPVFKIASCDINNFPLLEKVAEKQTPIILSTGSSSMEEVETTMRFLEKQCVSELVLMQCSAIYPARDEEINLKVLETFRECYGIPVGVSDHSLGVEISLAAAALGAGVIERHFTIDRTLPGGDNEMSVLPEEFGYLVKGSKRIKLALGKGAKEVLPTEGDILKQIRRSPVAAMPISQGEVFTKENLAIKRPGNGLVPDYYFKLLGKKAKCDMEEDEIITLEKVEEV